ncbi:ECF RNA polymerase sigma factor SigE [Dyadobacter sp. CECT 9275]|uniref:ECF RNA polymerase sigma factor SigE n=1 Tax=Dyadobacter helix TaxID=2822344 RepID=A0A916NM70_9BACT|nr:sigma-70 family RNA polymerase sigma factor [Dyadobacter sp. CECT 9275]CAG5004719.1 ECF RNA polymerase sigma factor SigE [Dyadobacter sp. CECT 9275]
MDQQREILDGCRRNDRKSQEELYYAFYPAMFSLCKKFFADEHEILTALNNGMMRVFKNIDQYDPRRGELFNWMYTVIRNACLTMIRDKKPETTQELKENMSDISQYDPFRSSEWDDIFHYLDQLPPATRAVCSLFYLEGFSIKEITKETGMKDGTVKWHLNESRNRLKTIFVKSKEL